VESCLQKKGSQQPHTLTDSPIEQRSAGTQEHASVLDTCLKSQAGQGRGRTSKSAKGAIPQREHRRAGEPNSTGHLPQFLGRSRPQMRQQECKRGRAVPLPHQPCVVGKAPKHPGVKGLYSSRPALWTKPPALWTDHCQARAGGKVRRRGKGPIQLYVGFRTARRDNHKSSSSTPAAAAPAAGVTATSMTTSH
jgi:hypothetical protein